MAMVHAVVIAADLGLSSLDGGKYLLALSRGAALLLAGLPLWLDREQAAVRAAAAAAAAAATAAEAAAAGAAGASIPSPANRPSGSRAGTHAPPDCGTLLRWQAILQPHV